jgi:hypothetical protein
MRGRRASVAPQPPGKLATRRSKRLTIGSAQVGGGYWTDTTGYIIIWDGGPLQALQAGRACPSAAKWQSAREVRRRWRVLLKSGCLYAACLKSTGFAGVMLTIHAVLARGTQFIDSTYRPRRVFQEGPGAATEVQKVGRGGRSAPPPLRRGCGSAAASAGDE